MIINYAYREGMNVLKPHPGEMGVRFLRLFFLCIGVSEVVTKGTAVGVLLYVL
jgi:hypothetical protein